MNLENTNLKTLRLTKILRRSLLFCIICSVISPLLVVAESASFDADATKLNLTLDVKGIRSDKGFISLQIYNTEAAFNDTQSDKAMATYVTRASEGGAKVTIHNIKKGVYAITLIHDENGNGELDWQGQVPTEGYAYSRGAGKYSLPDFQDASISLLKRSRNISLDLVYH
jgi:uncharacterized protein (DUF2141 family)